MTVSTVVGPSPSGGGPAPSLDREEFLADIGDRIRAERQARGWTQSHLGQRSDLSRKVIVHMEHGKNGMPLLNLVGICQGLGMGLGDLLSEAWVMPPKAPSGPVLTLRQARILQAASSGKPLAQVAAVVGTSRQVVAARLSETYRALGVAGLPRDERRAAAVRIAVARGLLEATAVLDAA